MNWKSISDLNRDIKRWIPELPDDLDLIVGIPRSGLLVANLLALYLNLPLTDVEGLCEGRILQAGRRCERDVDLSKKCKVLVVDDSVASGFQMQHIKAQIKRHRLPHQIYYGALYVTPLGTKYVDFWYELIGLPRVFEWNVMHSDILLKSCVDLDGVLCRDPTEEENDDGLKYMEFIKFVKPLIIPSKTIGYIVTTRLEKYRKETEEWLKRHRIKYNYLVMLNLPDKKTRQALGIHAEFKAGFYKSKNTVLFIESSLSQAIEIAKISGKPVLCTETWELIKPGKVDEIRSKIRQMPSDIGFLLNRFLIELKNDPIKAFRLSYRYLFMKVENKLLRFTIRFKKLSKCRPGEDK